MIQVKRGKIILPDGIKNKLKFPRLELAIDRFDPIKNDILNFSKKGFSGSLPKMLDKSKENLKYLRDGKLDTGSLPYKNDYIVKPTGPYGLTQYEYNDVMCPDPNACNYRQLGRCVYPIKGQCPDSFTQGGSGDFGVQSDGCCDEVAELESYIEQLELDNGILQTQVDAGMGLDFIEGGLTDEDGSIIYNPSNQELSYSELFQAYGCLHNYYEALYEEYVKATTICLQASNYIGWGPSIPSGGPGSSANDNMVNPLAYGPGIIFDFDPNYPAELMYPEWGVPDASPYSQTPYPWSDQTDVINLAEWLGGNLPATMVPFMSPRVFNMDLPPIGGFTNLCADSMPSSIGGLLEDILYAINNNDSVQITYAGVSPTYQNSYYVNLFSGMESTLLLLEQNLDEAQLENENLTNLLAETQSALQVATDALEAAVAENAGLNIQLTALQEAFAILETEFGDFVDLTEEQIQALIDQYELDLAEATSLNSQLAAINAELEAQIISDAETINGLEGELQTAQNALTQALQDVENAEQSFQQLQVVYQEAQEIWGQDLYDLGIDVQYWMDQANQFESDLAIANLENGDLEQIIGEMQQLQDNLLNLVIPGLEEQISALEAANQILEDDQGDLLQANLDLSDDIQGYLNDIQALTNLIDGYYIPQLLEAAQMATDYEALQDTCGTASDEQVQNLENQITALEAQLQNEFVPISEYNQLMQSFNDVNDLITQETLDLALDEATNSYDESMASSQAEFDLALSSLQQQLDEAQLTVPEDGVTQADVDAMQAYMQGLIDTIDVEDGVSQGDVDAIQNDLDALALSSGTNISNLTEQNSQLASDLAAQQAINSTLFTQEQLDAAIAEAQASVDITSNDEGVYNEAYALGLQEGAGGVDITADNEAVIAAAIDALPYNFSQEEYDAAINAAQQEAFNQGSTSVDITSDNQDAFDLGAASVEQLFSQTDIDNAFTQGQLDGAASITPEDGISQADVDAAYLQGQNSITPEDGISQSDVDQAYEDGISSVLQNFTQADIDAAYANGVASVTPEDGISQVDVDQAYQDGVNSVTPDDGITQADVDNAFNQGAASVTPDDGIGADQVANAFNAGYLQGQSESLATIEAGGAFGILQTQLMGIYADIDGFCEGYGYGVAAGIIDETSFTSNPTGSTDSSRPLLDALNEMTNYTLRLESQLGIKPSALKSNVSFDPKRIKDVRSVKNQNNLSPIKKRR
tara:strand:+ start:732 stop:4382 length:3651 start_codon:yes stop_codon:yes gene_type:complete